jgi:disulfide bond formation protein DsbB
MTKKIISIYKMNYFLSSLISFILVIVFGVLAYIFVSKDVYKNAEDATTCSQQGDKSSKTCGIWSDSGNICRKGTCEQCNGDCAAAADLIPIIMAGSAALFFIVFIVLLIVGFYKKSHKSTAQSQFSYDSLASNL